MLWAQVAFALSSAGAKQRPQFHFERGAFLTMNFDGLRAQQTQFNGEFHISIHLW